MTEGQGPETASTTEAGASSSELIQEVLKGENRALQLLAADGMLPLEPGELILLELSLLCALGISPHERESMRTSSRSIMSIVGRPDMAMLRARAVWSSSSTVCTPLAP